MGKEGGAQKVLKTPTSYLQFGFIFIVLSINILESVNHSSVLNTLNVNIIIPETFFILYCLY